MLLNIYIYSYGHAVKTLGYGFFCTLRTSPGSKCESGYVRWGSKCEVPQPSAS